MVKAEGNHRFYRLTELEPDGTMDGIPFHKASVVLVESASHDLDFNMFFQLNLVRVQNFRTEYYWFYVHDDRIEEIEAHGENYRPTIVENKSAFPL